eukprot:m.102316 g.102316  ORF g.102316 m.102316 type:complete len:327 (-) comp20801_c0_seq1:4133-5113(-)
MGISSCPRPSQNLHFFFFFNDPESRVTRAFFNPFVSNPRFSNSSRSSVTLSLVGSMLSVESTASSTTGSGAASGVSTASSSVCLPFFAPACFLPRFPLVGVSLVGVSAAAPSASPRDLRFLPRGGVAAASASAEAAALAAALASTAASALAASASTAAFAAVSLSATAAAAGSTSIAEPPGDPEVSGNAGGLSSFVPAVEAFFEPDFGVPFALLFEPDFGVPLDPALGVPLDVDFAVPFDADFGAPLDADVGAAVDAAAAPGTGREAANARGAGAACGIGIGPVEPLRTCCVRSYTNRPIEGMSVIDKGTADTSLFALVEPNRSFG